MRNYSSLHIVFYRSYRLRDWKSRISYPIYDRLSDGMFESHLKKEITDAFSWNCMDV